MAYVKCERCHTPSISNDMGLLLTKSFQRVYLAETVDRLKASYARQKYLR